MDVSPLNFDACPNWHKTEQRLRTALERTRSGATLTYVHVGTQEEGEWLFFRGSPTVMVDGRDPFAHAGDPVGLSHRVFWTPEGLRGAPSGERLCEASSTGPSSRLKPVYHPSIAAAAGDGTRAIAESPG